MVSMNISLKWEREVPPEASLPIYEIIRHHIPEYQSLKFKVYIL
jgi:hypothetical protein